MKNLKINKKKGFSLVELLVVIAVIGVIAAIAIPAMSNIFGNSKQAKAKRNAQNIASVYAAARAAGASFSVANEGNGADIDAVVTSLSTGIPGSGNFATSKFQISMDAAEVAAAKTYLDSTELTTGVLKYTGTAGN